MTEELRVEAKIDSLPEVIEFTTGTLTDDCPQRERMQVELMTEEIFVNIASYAYDEAGGFVTVRRSGGEGPEGLSISFIDEGKPFDPLKNPDPDVTLSAEERPVGGLGVFLVKRVVDKAEYEYKDGKNILTVYKVIGGKV